MSILSSLFNTSADFQKYVPYIEANAKFDTLNASALSASKQIKIILTPDIYTLIQNLPDDPVSEKKEALRNALANLTMSKQLSFDVIARRKNNIETYKYELEGMKRDYIQAYYASMDTLIAILNEEDSEAWKSTNYCKQLQTLQIKTTEEFDAIYPIDLSYLFFFRCIAWQREALDERLGTYFSRAEGKESVIALLKRALAKMTIAKALRRFDILEFPEIIRGLFTDSKSSRSGDSEQTQVLRLADQLSTEVEQIIASVEIGLTETTETNIPANTSFNCPGDKFYFMG